MPVRSRNRLASLARTLCIAASLAAWQAPAGAAESPDPEANRYYEDAVKRYNEKDFNGAVIQLKNALQQDPRMLPAMVLMGEVHVAQGNGAAAETALNEATQAGADVALTAVPLAKAYLMQFKHDQLLAQTMPPRLPLLKRAELLEVKAQAALQINDSAQLREILAEVDRIDPNAVGALSIKATLAMRDGRLEDAQRFIEQATQIAPDNATVWLTRASVHHVRGDAQGALEAYGRVIAQDPANSDARLARVGLLLDLGREKDTEADLEFLANQGIYDPRLQYLRAVKLVRAGDTHGARSALNEAANAIEVLGDTIVLRNVQLLLVAGVVNYSLGNNEKARTYLEEYIKSAGGEIETRKMLATLLMRQGDFRRASRLLEEVVRGAGESPDLLAMLASAYTAAGEHQRATGVLERAASLRPGDPALATRLALSRANRGQMDAALGELASVFAEEAYREVAGLPLAVLHMNRGNYVEGEKVAEVLYAAEPDNLTYINLLGVAKVGLGKLRDARFLFEKALTLDPDYQPADFNLGKLDRREGNFDAAERRFTTLLGRAPDDAETMLELGRTAAARGDADGALKWAKDAADAAPRSFEVAQFLVEQYIAKGDFAAAHDVAWSQAQVHPDNLFVMESQVNILGAEGKFDELRPILKRMVEAAQFNNEWLFKIADMQRRANFASDAQYTLYKAVQGQPNDLPARALLAEVELELGHAQAAQELAQALVDDFPDHPAGHALLGDVQTDRGDHAAAAAHFARAIDLARNPMPALVLKQHLALRRSGDGAAAIAVLEEWLKRHPDDVWAKGALGEHAMASGRYQVAKARFEEFLRSQPDHLPTLNNLANVMLKLNAPDQALRHARKAYDMAPENPLINDTLGWILVNMGNIEEGLPYLREARTRAATVPEIRYHLAVALHRQGRRSEALGELTAALGMDEDFDGRGEAERLRETLGG